MHTETTVEYNTRRRVGHMTVGGSHDLSTMSSQFNLTATDCGIATFQTAQNYITYKML